MDNATIDLQHQFYDMLMRSQYWSPERMRDYQRSQLEQLLRHARKNVPFYETRLDAVFTPSGDIDWERWHELPLVRRSDLIDHKQALLALDLPVGHGPVGRISTSGSTGTPVEIHVTNLTRLSSQVARWRSQDWLDLDYSQTLCIRRGEQPEIRPPHGAESGPWGPPWLDSSRNGRSYTMTRGWSVPDQLDFLIHTRAPYVGIGGAKIAHILAAEARRHDIQHSVSHFLVNSERPNDDDRQTVRSVFGAEMIELYSSKEGGHMAHPCQPDGGLHVNAERLLLEIVDADGRPVGPGEQGRVVITPLHSTAQPLIRYLQGDLARWGTCTCGRTLPFLASIDGRDGHMFRHPDGRRVASGFPEKYRTMLDAGLWQLAQVGPTAFELRYVPNDPNRIGDEAGVLAGFRDWYFDDADLQFRRVTAIPFAKSGKYLEYTYEVDDAAGHG